MIVIVYIDETLLCSKAAGDSVKHLVETVLKVLQEQKIRLASGR